MKALILLATAMPLFGQCEDVVYRGEGVSVRLRAVGGRLRQDYMLTVTGGAAGPAYAVGLHEYPDTAGVSCRCSTAAVRMGSAATNKRSRSMRYLLGRRAIRPALVISTLGPSAVVSWRVGRR